MVKVIPTLSSSGWVKGTTEKIDRALSYALLTDGLQSTIYKGNLTSIPSLIQGSLNDPSDLYVKASTMMQLYMERLFDDVNIDVEIRELPNDPSRLNLVFRIRVVDNGVSYDVAREATMLNGSFVKITKLNN